jgi:hypothetical protein
MATNQASMARRQRERERQQRRREKEAKRRDRQEKKRADKEAGLDSKGPEIDWSAAVRAEVIEVGREEAVEDEELAVGVETVNQS